LKGDNLEVSARSVMSENVSILLPVFRMGKEMDIGFNGKFLISGLQMFSECVAEDERRHICWRHHAKEDTTLGI